jgi:hypothetical protein
VALVECFFQDAKCIFHDQTTLFVLLVEQHFKNVLLSILMLTLTNTKRDNFYLLVGKAEHLLDLFLHKKTNVIELENRM